MDALLAVEAERARDLAGLFESSFVVERRIRSVETTQPIYARGSDYRLHDGMPAMAGIERVVLVHRADVGRGHPHRRREIALSEDHPLDAWRRRGDLANVHESGGCLDLHREADLPRKSAVRLDLPEQRRDEC